MTLTNSNIVIICLKLARRPRGITCSHGQAKAWTTRDRGTSRHLSLLPSSSLVVHTSPKVVWLCGLLPPFLFFLSTAEEGRERRGQSIKRKNHTRLNHWPRCPAKQTTQINNHDGTDPAGYLPHGIDTRYRWCTHIHITFASPESIAPK